MDAILSILKSLGYEKTLDEDQVQVKESVDAVRALWVSLDLFLVQLDLQIIKEIMDNFTDSKLSLKHFIRARERTHNVKDACHVLSAAATKRAKTEKVRDSETSSQRQPTPTKIGDIPTSEDVIHVPAYAVSSADSESKNSDLSAATETTAMDTDETLTGTEGITSVSSSDAYTRSRVDALHGYVPSSKHPAPFMGVNINDRDLYGAHAEENQLETKQERFVAPHGTSDRTRHLNTSELISQSLPYLGTATSPLPNYRYSTQGNTQFNWRDRHGIIVNVQSGRVRPLTRIPTYSYTTDTEINTSTGRQVQGSSRSDKYSGLPDIHGAARHKVASNESFQSYRQKETETQQKNSTAMEDRRKLAAAEPMEVEPSETTANRVENLNSNSKKMTEGAYVGREAQSTVSDYSRWSSRPNEFVGGAYSTPKAQSGVSEYSRTRDRSSRSKESTGRTFFRPEAQSGVSDLNKNLHNNLTLENGASKEAAVRSSSAEEATPYGAGTIRVEYLPGRDDAAVSQSNSSPLPNDVTGARPVDGRGYSLYKREENGLSNDVRRNTHISTGSSATRFLQDERKADQKFLEFKSKRDDYSERSEKDHLHGAEALSVKKDRQSSDGAGTTRNLSSGYKPTICSHCMRPKGELICQNCFLIMCKACDKIAETDLCERTKGKHIFVELKENGLSNDVRRNTHISTGSSATRFLQDERKADQKFLEFKSKRDDYSERSEKDHLHGAEALSVKKDRQSSDGAGTTRNLSSGYKPTICSHCMRPKGELICQNCFLIMCKACDKIAETDLCERTKGKHIFVELKDGGVSKKTENLSDTTSSNQPLFSPVYEGNEWSCSRCTFLNQLEHKICVMCGATRGVGDVEQSKPGSRVCGNCTFHNERDATVCKACFKTLDKSESFV